MPIQHAEDEIIDPNNLDTGEAAREAVRLLREMWKYLRKNTATKEDVQAVAKTAAALQRRQDEIATAEMRAKAAAAATFKSNIAEKDT